jgi:hypothetical protein
MVSDAFYNLNWVGYLFLDISKGPYFRQLDTILSSCTK